MVLRLLFGYGWYWWEILLVQMEIYIVKTAIFPQFHKYDFVFVELEVIAKYSMENGG